MEYFAATSQRIITRSSWLLIDGKNLRAPHNRRACTSSREINSKKHNMINNKNTVSVTYTDTELRNLVEEYITQQKSGFTLKGVCSYVL